ncbi:MAG: flagellar biosynthesis protein FliQ [Pirellulaceae bacterium]
MDPHTAVDLCQQAILTCIIVGAPVLIVGMLVGLISGLLQALTQVQDQTVSFVPKILAMVIALAAALPWLIQRMMDYSEGIITDIPRVISGS